jgi:hypothetical protein
VRAQDADGGGAVVALTLRRWGSPEPDLLRH